MKFLSWWQQSHTAQTLLLDRTVAKFNESAKCQQLSTFLKSFILVLAKPPIADINCLPLQGGYGE
jgi:hypothetical protein